MLLDAKPKRQLQLVLGSILLTVIAVLLSQNLFQYGIEMDEVLRLNPLFSVINSKLSYYDQSLYSMSLFGHKIPIVFKLYVSSAIMFPYLPITFAENPFIAMRVMSFLYFLLAGLVPFWVFYKRSFGWALLLGASLLLSPFLSPHVFVRQTQTYHIICYALSFMFFDLYYSKAKKPLYLFGASFFVFLAVNLEFYAAWSVAALALVVPFLSWSYIKEIFKDRKSVFFFFLGTLGCFNFFIYNFANKFPVLQIIYQFLFNHEEYNKAPIDGRVMNSLTEDLIGKYIHIKMFWGPQLFIYISLFIILILISNYYFVAILKRKIKEV